MTAVTFGTDGIRGVAGQHPITVDVASRIGAAVAIAQNESSTRLLVATDTRATGPMLARAVCEGALRHGANVMSVGVWPTPAVGCALAAGQADAAIIVTASHNPSQDNGFKIMLSGGRKPPREMLKQLERLIEDTPAPNGSAGRELPPIEPSAWWDALSTGLGSLSALAGRRLAVDFANGAGGIAKAWLDENTPAHWVVASPDSSTINDGCGSEHLGHLSKVIAEGDFEGGLALDGDGDRCRLVDAQGQPVPGDAVLWLLANDSHADTIAVTVMSNMGLEVSLPATRVIRTPVGDAHIEAALQSHGIPVGGEESGHIRFHDHPTGDGLFAGLRALDAAFRAGGVARSIAGYTPYATTQFKVPVSSRPSLDDHPILSRLVHECEERLGEEGRVFLRYSGTEPVLRVLIEGSTEDIVHEISEITKATLTKVYG